ncbi:hypothetical protein ACH5RR_004500 [Cinchona calisaya]|uniref:Late embryogenesis abundant protein LEA-2 subgroup domain-containing protein n=1 Tax=Cinchona calisaya TaxID=153742 RepID=A0ABD3AXS1_9GENT
MASYSTTSPSTFSSAATAAAASGNGGNKKFVTGYPLVGRPGDSRVIVTACPQARTTPPPPPSSGYLHQVLYYYHHKQHQNRVQQLQENDEARVYRLMAAVMCFLIFMGGVFIILWLFLNPQPPEVHLASATLSPLSTTASDVSVACNVSLLFTNPNSKATIFYDNLELFVVYKPHRTPLFKAQIPPFVQLKGNDTVLHVQMEISDVSLGNDVVKALKEDLVFGSMSFVVKVFVLMRFESQDLKTRTHLIKVYCDDVILGFPSVEGPGNIVNPYKDCRVRYLSQSQRRCSCRCESKAFLSPVQIWINVTYLLAVELHEALKPLLVKQISSGYAKECRIAMRYRYNSVGYLFLFQWSYLLLHLSFQNPSDERVDQTAFSAGVLLAADYVETSVALLLIPQSIKLINVIDFLKLQHFKMPLIFGLI